METIIHYKGYLIHVRQKLILGDFGEKYIIQIFNGVGLDRIWECELCCELDECIRQAKEYIDGLERAWKLIDEAEDI